MAPFGTLTGMSICLILWQQPGADDSYGSHVLIMRAALVGVRSLLDGVNWRKNTRGVVALYPPRAFIEEMIFGGIAQASCARVGFDTEVAWIGPDDRERDSPNSCLQVSLDRSLCLLWEPPSPAMWEFPRDPPGPPERSDS
ncbi:hypothetical protein AAFF_G00049740 [Aldrovandia affinis]|uniref:Uncharacterized protein n=1 Tax=Aldrovandia affinis TaxID=143900 RepID=A0AAD7WFL5_9TELE|nr:hypothetical protein AAFF_G00049740 [Aldrovandia affinis]